MSEDDSLPSAPLCALLPDEEWARLARYPEQTYLAGRTLLRQGDPGTHVLALVEGLVKVVRTEPDGRQRVLSFRGRGEILGEMALQPSSVRMADVRALRKSRACIVPAQDFHRFVQENKLARPIFELAWNRMREQVELCEGAVHERLALALLRLVAAAGGGKPCFSLTREELAQHIDVGRKAVSKALERLGPDCVRVGNRRIEVVSVAGLRKAAGGHVGG
ncbi:MULTISPECIES: Crp/Fnr family transcriptional regulator [Streptomyces]|uniref:Crp/Fnr family transcriptional regulator n=1 Tax=Streptomyces TaxID=1883 RepID=UPI0002FC9F85|nr:MULTISPECIES: cyclic nucleotide-binding domain-containing protein [Streptomyces]WTD08661.1 cyclic nucleotide-binding domain-containing protein [Streptomyces anulatus]WTD29243.1 cyclic nucleotide-binding domain-containing protein [Streptomyces anulatus]WTE01949.1 cyclic nucleotide-binding domain-containing protein [Streptomyces anulatus]WTE24994.1 cyclic nucleotide-binding domain-containing protein [Streptomyces anulatus]